MKRPGQLLREADKRIVKASERDVTAITDLCRVLELAVVEQPPGLGRVVGLIIEHANMIDTRLETVRRKLAKALSQIEGAGHE